MRIYTEIVRTINIGLSTAEAEAVQALVMSNSDIERDVEIRKLASEIFNGLRIQLDQTHRPLEETSK